jgi:hypothetical protein
MGEMAATDSGNLELGWFLKSLIEEGRAVVGSGSPAEDSANGLAALTQLNELAGVELGLAPPPFSSVAALWAARLIYHLCQFTVCRDISPEQINSVCGVPCPETRGPETDWSADLTLRHLPKIFQLACHLSQADPLIQNLKQIATDWPLSSVGIPGLEISQIESFFEHPTLRRLYADRIIAAEDTSRLNDPRVAAILRADLGIHHELAPALAPKLYPATHDTHRNHLPPLHRSA